MTKKTPAPGMMITKMCACQNFFFNSMSFIEAAERPES